MFRKSRPMSPTSFDPRKQLTEADFKIFSRRALITLIRWSKIIQFRERVVEIPLLRIPRSPLCATALSSTRFALWPRVLARALRYLTSWMNTSLLKFFIMDLLFLFCAITLHRSVSTPSFRGALLLQGWGIIFFPIELIKAVGDWCSDTILIYLTMPLTVRLYSANMHCKTTQQQNSLHPHTN